MRGRAVNALARTRSNEMENHSLTHAIVDPLVDARWRQFALHHADAVVFHQTEWIACLVDGFGCEPRFHTLLDDSARIVAAWPLMRVRGFLGSNRLVCLPFCHRAGPLLTTADQAQQLIAAVRTDAEAIGADWVETRGWPDHISIPEGFQPSHGYIDHVIDVSGGPESIWHSFGRGVRRSVKRAVRDGVQFRIGQGSADFDIFFALYRDQRRAQRLLPQPRRFLFAVWKELVAAGNGFLVIAEHSGQPVCALLAVGHGNTVIGTHSGSTRAARNLMAMPLAMWKSAELASTMGYSHYDLGRSEAGDSGLEQFKDALGAAKEPLTYYYSPEPKGVNSGKRGRLSSVGLRLVTKVAPNAMFEQTGSMLYRYLG